MKIAKLELCDTEEEFNKYVHLGCVSTNKIDLINFILGLLLSSFYAFSFGYGLYSRVTLISLKELINNTLGLFVLLMLGWYIILFLHELIHLIFYPKGSAYLGYNLNKLMISIHFKGEISKVRLIFTLLIPFILFTIIPTLLFFIKEFNIIILAIAILNTIMSSKDIINIILVMKYMKNNKAIMIIEDNIYYEDISELLEDTEDAQGEINEI